MSACFLAAGLIFVLMLAGVTVDRLYRRFADRHPQLGPFRKNEGRCTCCGPKCVKERQQ